MSKEYAEKCIRDALKDAKGNPTRAQQSIIAEAVKDHKLLLYLTRGHLKGIVSLWVNRVIEKISREPEPVPEEPESLEMEPNDFGKEILQVMRSGDAAKFGQENAAPRRKHKQASQNHIDAINMMAKASKSNKNSDDSDL